MFQTGDFFQNDPAVNFKLGFPFAPVSTGSSSLPRKVSPRPGQTGKAVLHPGQTYLQKSFTSPGMFTENLQNHLLPVNYTATAELFQVSLLRRRDGIIENKAIHLICL